MLVPWRGVGRFSAGGRLLNEFLVSLGLFFLILTGDLMILSSAGTSSSRAGATREALNLAQEGLERLIALPDVGAPLYKQQSFSSRGNSAKVFSYSRTLQVTPLSGEHGGLSLASVVVDWDGGTRKLRLERYVSKL